MTWQMAEYQKKNGHHLIKLYWKLPKNNMPPLVNWLGLASLHFKKMVNPRLKNIGNGSINGTIILKKNYLKKSLMNWTRNYLLMKTYLITDQKKLIEMFKEEIDNVVYYYENGELVGMEVS